MTTQPSPLTTPPAATPTHGGARPGAGRKPKPDSDLSSLLDALSADSTVLAQLTARLTEAIPQLLEALTSLATGTTTTRERWVAAGTLTTGIGSKTRLLMPNLPVDQLVLVSRNITTHKPDLKALLFLLEHFLGKLPLTIQPEMAETPSPTSLDTPVNTQPETEPITPPQPTPDSSSGSPSVSPCLCGEPKTDSETDLIIQLHSPFPHYASASPRLCGSSFP